MPQTVTEPADPGKRSEAFEGYLERRRDDGYQIETRSTWQAVIVRRHPLHRLLRIAGSERGQQRLVVSVDDAGEVTTIVAEPRRW
jgi:hypothetical protein